jgi:hypothetical protein
MTPMRELTDVELDAVSGGDAVITVIPPNNEVPVAQVVIPALPPSPIRSNGIVTIIPVEG